MKVFFALRAVVLWLALWAACFASLAAAQAAEVRLLVLEVSPEDAAAAQRLVELLAEPAERLLMAAARNPGAAQAALLHSSAPRAVVLDSAARRVQVVERNGRTRTRLIEAEATPYLTAFVASELLALDPPPAPHEVVPEPAVVHAHFARLGGLLALDVASAYTTRWLARPKLGLDLWISAARAQRAQLALALELVPAVPLHESSPLGSIALLRWDSALSLGAAFPVNAWRLLLLASGRIAITRATSSGAADREEHTVALGLGGAFRVERSLTKRLGLFASVDAHALLRRNAYELAGELLLQERFLMVSANFGLVLHTPER
jgi:hypothetical protein